MAQEVLVFTTGEGKITRDGWQKIILHAAFISMMPLSIAFYFLGFIPNERLRMTTALVLGLLISFLISWRYHKREWANEDNEN